MLYDTTMQGKDEGREMTKRHRRQKALRRLQVVMPSVAEQKEFEQTLARQLGVYGEAYIHVSADGQRQVIDRKRIKKEK